MDELQVWNLWKQRRNTASKDSIMEQPETTNTVVQSIQRNHSCQKTAIMFYHAQSAQTYLLQASLNDTSRHSKTTNDCCRIKCGAIWLTHVKKLVWENNPWKSSLCSYKDFRLDTNKRRVKKEKYTRQKGITTLKVGACLDQSQGWYFWLNCHPNNDFLDKFVQL